MVKRFKGVVAVNQVSLTVGVGEILGIIGPNGASKTTLMNVINGIRRSESGQVFFNGIDLAGLEVHQIARLGIARTFQIPRIFRRLSVLDNVVASGFKKGGRDRALELLSFVRLSARGANYA